MKGYKDFLLNLRAVVAEVKDTLEAIETDDVLSQSTIDGGEMQQQNILQAAREKVVQLQAAVREAFEEKQKLEEQAKQLREERESGKRKFTVPARSMGAGDAFSTSLRAFTQDPASMGEDTAAWLRENHPDLLPRPRAFDLPVEQQAKLAHSEYVDACYRLQAAKMDLGRLEKKVADMAAIMRCVEAA